MGDDPPDRVDLQDGDRALRALLLTHGLIMNSGVLQCVHESLSESELEAAIEGYAYFGFDDVVATLRDAAAIEDPWAETQELASLDFEARYTAAIPTDATIADGFETRLMAHPEDFVGRRVNSISPGTTDTPGLCNA